MIEISGKVKKGKGLGKTIGFPTANIEYNGDNLDDGTYKINGVIDGIIYNGAGVYLKSKKLFEAHFFDLDKILYGKNIEIIIFKKIRENKKFKTLEEIKKQIEKDLEIIKSEKSYVVTFGTFDIYHPGHEYYLKTSKKYADKLITVIAKDSNVYKLKNIKCRNNETTRYSIVKNTNIPDVVVLGDLKDPLKIIKEYKPKVICLGYDQKGFKHLLDDYIQETNLDIVIKRIGSYKEDKYKSSILKEKK